MFRLMHALTLGLLMSEAEEHGGAAGGGTPVAPTPEPAPNATPPATPTPAAAPATAKPPTSAAPTSEPQTPAAPGEDGLADLTQEQLLARLRAEQQQRADLDARYKALEGKFTPLEQAERERREREEKERPLSEKLSKREEELKAQREENERLTARVRNADLYEQLNRAGYASEEISDIVDLATQEEIIYDENKGAYRLDLSRFIARKPRYTTPAAQIPPPPADPKNPQRIPPANSQRRKVWTDAEIAALSPEDFEKHRPEIYASRNVK